MNAKMKIQAAAICSLLLASAACSSRPGSGGGAGVVSTGGGAAPAAAPAGGGVVSASDKPLDVMLKATRAQLDAKSYRANVKNTASNGTTTAMVIEYAAPDRYHMVTHSQAGGRDTALEYVILGKDSFMKMNGGEWRRFPADMSQMISAFRNPKFIEELAKASDLKLVGPDTLDGAPMLVYEYTINNVMGMKMTSRARTWVAVADGLPRRSESEGEYSGVKTKTEMTVSDYNSDIKIEAPIK